MGNKRNRRSTPGQLPSLERFRSEASQGNETMIETLSNFYNVSSVKDRKAVLIDTSQNENDMQVWTQRVIDNTNEEIAELRKEMNEKFES